MAKERKTQKVWHVTSRPVGDKGKQDVEKTKRRLTSEGYRITGVQKLPSGNNIMIIAQRSI